MWNCLDSEVHRYLEADKNTRKMIDYKDFTVDWRFLSLWFSANVPSGCTGNADMQQ